MAIRSIVKMGFCFLTAVIMAGCTGHYPADDYQPSTSHLGTGQYHCYYQNQQTGYVFEGINDHENASQELARKHCAAKEVGATACVFVACLFR